MARSKGKVLGQGSLAWLMISMAYPAFGEGLEEVVVTAQKREQTLQEVPVSVAVVGGEQLQESNISNLDDLSAHVPNLQVSTSAYSTIFIRGLGSDFNYGFEQSVGTYIDNVYMPKQRQARMRFFDLERVEVLRGPQGTLFGKNTIAGALNITTAKPTDEYEGFGSIQVGDRNQEIYQLSLSGPIIEDRLLGRIALYDGHQGGWMENRTGNDGISTNDQAVRLTTTLLITDSLDATLKLEKGDYFSGGSNYQLNRLGNPEKLPFFSGSDPGVEANVDDQSALQSFGNNHLTQSLETETAVLAVNYDFAGDYTLTSTTGYNGYETDDMIDFDYSSADAVFSHDVAEFDHITQEFRLVSPQDNSTRWIAGIYYEDRSYSRDGSSTQLDLEARMDPSLLAFLQSVGLQETGTITPIIFNIDTTSWASYFELTQDIGDQFAITAGVRYTEEEKDGNKVADYMHTYSNTSLYNKDANGCPDPTSLVDAADATYNSVLTGAGFVAHCHERTRKTDQWLPAIKLQWFAADEAMFYASVNTGFKSGGFNANEQTGNAELFEFDDEESTNIELGAKLKLLDNTLQLNAALYRTEFENLQVSSWDGQQYIVTNAAEARSQGLEVDVEWLLNDMWRVGGSYAFSDAQYKDFQNSACTFDQKVVWENNGGDARECRQDLSGQDMQYAPDNTASLWLGFNTSFAERWELNARTDLMYSDEIYLQQDLDPIDVQDSYVKMNFRIGLRDLNNDWEVALLAKNLTDETTLSRSQDVGLVEEGYHSAATEAPRTIAAQFNWHFL